MLVDRDNDMRLLNHGYKKHGPRPRTGFLAMLLNDA